MSSVTTAVTTRIHRDKDRLQTWAYFIHVFAIDLYLGEIVGPQGEQML